MFCEVNRCFTSKNFQINSAYQHSEILCFGWKESCFFSCLWDMPCFWVFVCFASYNLCPCLHLAYLNGPFRNHFFTEASPECPHSHPLLPKCSSLSTPMKPIYSLYHHTAVGWLVDFSYHKTVSSISSRIWSCSQGLVPVGSYPFSK